ncbi:radical SAM/SPASM domain-containing protein [Haliangium ochraceum]|uniref:radical SAM/SPASM domain-containing protein n=1 Tax=Haliangium ochraceum TaxID=80816 RepID=UPI00019BB066|nr:radical SAM protein [Haliangium ochraceum]
MTPRRAIADLLRRGDALGRAAARALRSVRERARGLRRHRLEPFGAIVQLAVPRALVFIDRARARRLGIAPGAGDRVWRDPDDDGALGRSVLSAPLEAHLQLTNRCDAGCAGCYTGATPRGGAGEWGLEAWQRTIDELAAMGVFHVALGGGESVLLPWLGDIARYARARGIVPNLTTSGLTNLERLLRIADEFGQINVSLDGLGATYAAVRGFDGFARADRAIRALRQRKREIGINVVVTRHNFDQIDEIFAYARARGLNEIELLRFKPAGRGRRSYAAQACSDEQHRRFLPLVLAACRRHRVRARVDCSYTPMLAHHRPAPELLAGLAVYGCTGGDFLIGVKATGMLSACSFAAAPPEKPRADALSGYWQREGAFGPFRQWRDAEEPCRSCDYHRLCRGGCRVVSAHVLGDAARPDPECPRVIDWHAARADSEPE